MDIEFRKAEIADAELLIEIYNAAFYSDYLKYGECPAYGRTREMMEQSIINYPKHLIIVDSKPVGCISCIALITGLRSCMMRMTKSRMCLSKLGYG